MEVADAAEARQQCGLDIDVGALGRNYDLVVLAVPHEAYVAMGRDGLRGLVKADGVLADLTGTLGKSADWTL